MRQLPANRNSARGTLQGNPTISYMVPWVYQVSYRDLTNLARAACLSAGFMFCLH